MALTIIRGTNQKPVSSRALAQVLSGDPNIEGELYIGYPILGSADGRLAIDALLVSLEHGLVLFDLVEGVHGGEYETRQYDAANVLEAKLRVHKELVLKRTLLVDIHTLTYGPAVSDLELNDDTECPVANSSTLLDVLKKQVWEASDEHILQRARSAIQNISTIRQGKGRREVKKDDSRGARLKRLEGSIATLDAMQSRAVIETVEGVQRIRGLAGSGKTIVLALKAAYLHSQHPDWRIAVTFTTRSLKAQFHRFINTFFVSQTGEEPDWDRIRIVNTWGAPGQPARDGLYYEFCRTHQVEYYDFENARQKFGRNHEFQSACAHALKTATEYQELYDAILIDEAQDCPKEFLRLCYAILAPTKNLVYAYDELQNLSGETMPPPEDIFGLDDDKRPIVSLSDPTPSGARRDITLDICYRNSRPVLSSAHALGFGIYRRKQDGPTGLVQMFDQPSLWSEIGYNVKSGELTPGHKVVLERTDYTSPPFLENHSPLEDLIQFWRFESKDDQAAWLANEIKINLADDELQGDDIVVINPDPLTTRNETGPIRALLLKHGVTSHLAGVTTNPDVFFLPDNDSVTFTGVYRAKGNEAGMVYIINANDCFDGFNLASARNRLFTAITRSKAWVRVLGVGDSMNRLSEEFTRICKHNFELDFKYPTDEERKYITIVHRDIPGKARASIKAGQPGMRALLAELVAGTVRREDLDPDVQEYLRQIAERIEE